MLKAGEVFSQRLQVSIHSEKIFTIKSRKDTKKKTGYIGLYP